MLEPGWLARQLDLVREESAKLPSWMQYSSKQENKPASLKAKAQEMGEKPKAKKRG